VQPLPVARGWGGGAAARHVQRWVPSGSGLKAVAAGQARGGRVEGRRLRGWEAEFLPPFTAAPAWERAWPPRTRTEDLPEASEVSSCLQVCGGAVSPL